MYKRYRILFTVALSVAIRASSFSQDGGGRELAQQLILIAEQIMEETQAMDQARETYVQAVEADPENIVANYRAGDFHMKTVGKDRAVNYFLKVLELDPEYRFDITYWIGRSYQYGMEFDKALAYYNRYKSKLTEKDGYRGRDRTELPDVERRIYECNNAIEYVANPANFSIVNVGGAINSEFDDFAPVVNEDETLMIFTTRRRDGNLNENVFSDNKPYEDIFYTEKKNGVWSPAQNIGEIINTEFHDSNLALSADGKQLFLYKDDNNGDIYESYRKDDGTWSYPQSMSENINSEGFKESSISISPDGSILFFSSDRPGGQGGIDIYYSAKDDNGEWTRSRNLGPIINTEFDDDGPFIDYDGKTLYFSSQGRKGMGGYDIFKSEYDSAESKWTEPVNVGFPINTPDDDVYFVSTKDGKRGYYASVREDGQGFTDIYQVSVLRDDEAGETLASKGLDDEKTDAETPDTTDPEKVEVDATSDLQPVTLTVTVVDDKGANIDAKISLSNKADGRMAGKSTKGTGVYVFTVTIPESMEYNLSVEKSGYVFQNVDISVPAATSKGQDISRKVTLRPLQVGTRKILRNIYFDFDKATFKDDSYTELNKLEAMVAQNPGMTIEISGHTDNIGAKAYNKSLSQRRANAVKNYLINKGIDARRITSIGYGEERPLASNDDEREGRELNRRVEFKVIGK
ncbi:MAG: OmpA family protein [Bacteroidota bacterium]